MAGHLGHLLIVIAFVTACCSVFAYIKAGRSGELTQMNRWTQLARGYFLIHGLSAIAALVCLFLIVYNHRYEYHYAWKHSADGLPLHYLISSLWEGQEGSFLLWVCWNVLVGLVLLKTSHLESQTMAPFGMIQVFLLSMILGSHLAGLKIGSSPFLLLKEVMPSDIFKIDPDFVPADGTGLNPLLQNFWMAIHPPVIFLGFALSGAPFVLSVAALWKGDTNHYIKSVTPWVLVTAGVLGAGIMMGAYWAYETLNFGGYWNWDPVENAILIPWLIFMAAVHGAVLYRRKGKGLALTMALAMAGFILVVYATFLTRSGILGNASVHSFTDLGLSGQLLFFLLFFTLVAGVLLIFRRASLKEADQNTTFLSLDFWMLLGIGVLCLSAFQVLLPTSIPVFNTLLESIGISKNLAPPADPAAFYSKFQIGFAIAFCVAAGLGQLFHWKRIKNRRHLENYLLIPATTTLILASLIIYVGNTSSLAYISLITSAIYLIIIGVQVGWSLIRNMERTSIGGTLAHLGMALMLLGFVYSAGHQKVISQNLTINAPGSDLPIHTVQENLLLSRNIPKGNNGYHVTYLGKRYESAGKGHLIPADETLPLPMSDQIMIARPVKMSDGWLSPGDTVNINPENIYYDLEIKDRNGEHFSITPRMQNNPTMGYIASPDIESFFTRDIYTHITNFPDPEKVRWNTPVKRTVRPGETFEVDGLTVQLGEIAINENPVGIPQSAHDVPLEATVTILDEYSTYTAHPIFHIDENRSVRLFPDMVDALGVKVLLSGINPELNEYELTVVTSVRDWITIKSIELPMISLVWLGAFVLTAGIGVALRYRIVEAKAVKATSARTQTTTYTRNNWKVIVNQKATVNT